MSLLSWGKCLIEHATSTKGVPAEAWTATDTPKEDTTIQEQVRTLISSSSICLSRKAANAHLRTMTA